MTSAQDHQPLTGEPHEVSRIGVVLVAAGRGERLGAGKPKAFVELGGRTLVEHCLRTVTSLPSGGHLVIVVPEHLAGETLRLVAAAEPTGANWEVSVTPGGRERHESVKFGVDALPEYADVVLVHDAARPLTPAALFARVTAEVRRTTDAVIPALPVVDTLKRVGADSIVHETVDRAPLVAVQTPQGFPRELLAAAHDRLGTGAHDDAAGHPTDDAEVVQRAGGTVRTVPGESLAHKLTTPGDLALLEALLAAQNGDAR